MQEVVSLGDESQCHPSELPQLTGRHLSPAEWHESLIAGASNKKSQKPPVLLDTRNIYETSIGHFDVVSPQPKRLTSIPNGTLYLHLLYLLSPSLDGCNGPFLFIAVVWQGEKTQSCWPLPIIVNAMKVIQWFRQSLPFLILNGASIIGFWMQEGCELIDPRLRHFSEFPEWLKSNKAALADRQVLMYCTGGVRCERASALVKSLGPDFNNVSQLQGKFITPSLRLQGLQEPACSLQV